MINTWSELFAAIRKWLDTPLKWERKVKEEIKKSLRPSSPHGDYPSSLDVVFDPELQAKARQSYHEALLQHDRNRMKYDDIQRRLKLDRIPFCQNCKDVGCEECQQWPMNQ